MNYIKLTSENLDKEHICCAISNNADPQVSSKKAWLKERISEGLVFLKAEERGKCFIEYLPKEAARVPIEAEGYMHINCLWVSGQMKGHGYARDLLDMCIQDSKQKGKKGLCVIASPKKMPFLSDPAFLTHKGFQVADSAPPYFSLMYLPFEKNSTVPKFKEAAKKQEINRTGTCSIIPTVVRIRQNTYRSSKGWHVKTTFRFKMCFWIVRKRRSLRPLLGQTMPCFTKKNLLPTKFFPRKNFCKCLQITERLGQNRIQKGSNKPIGMPLPFL